MIVMKWFIVSGVNSRLWLGDGLKVMFIFICFLCIILIICLLIMLCIVMFILV